ncbi:MULTISPECIES: SRPBCC family protein [Lysinibacillus]|uniref:SRPBCC family protein n=1 Tax=Lysinibacillus TaxID=400634 RepID=UPI00232CBF74|nr:SRPBCC family protein [Lysinibacillus sp. OF-1]WCH47882.1 SRPBCC family protein [Lysinibacillus sp. OF-1]WKT76658.1 SRPBCC family protein [Lysinibacillus fusiformis]WKT77450.1 SRPBCC family protein [Lysinibacillus fusiformis]
MATGQYSKNISMQKERLEEFIQNKEQWAVLIPGYLHHELLNENDMIWVFQGDFGIIQKAVKVELKVKKSDAHQILFDLEGLSDPINGDGSFEIKQNQDQSLQLTGKLTMKASGFLAGMMNPVLDNFVPRLVEQLVKEMAVKVVKE